MYLSRMALWRRPLALLVVSMAGVAGMACLQLAGPGRWGHWPQGLAVLVVWTLALAGLLAAWIRATSSHLERLYQAVADDSPQALARRPAEVVQALEGCGAWFASGGPWMALVLLTVLLGVMALTLTPWGPAGGVEMLITLTVAVIVVRELMGAWWWRSVLPPLWAFDAAWRRWRAQVPALQADADGSRSLAMLNWLGEVRRGVRRFQAQVQAPPTVRDAHDMGRELGRLRLIVFATALSEELMRPFFAVFAMERSAQVALPVGMFMLTLALAQPLGPWLTRRFETSRALAAVALLGGACLLLTAASGDAATLVALRAVSGVVYGLILILAQTTIVRITEARQRARGLTEVSAAIVAAGVCGPALGGLLAERLGTGAAFAACAACLGAAALLSLRIAPLRSSERSGLATLGGWRGIAAVMAQPHVAAVTWFAAVPARLAAAALLVVLTPLYLEAQAVPAHVTGQVLLLYFLLFVVSAPWVARWSDLKRRRRPWIIAGCGLSALACAALPLVGGVAGAALCCGLLGVAQALLSAPQLALVTEKFDHDPRTTQALGATPEQALAAFRFVERVGSVVAPFAVALAVAQVGLAGAASLLALLLLAGTIALVAGLWSHQE